MATVPSTTPYFTAPYSFPARNPHPFPFPFFSPPPPLAPTPTPFTAPSAFGAPASGSPPIPPPPAYPYAYTAATAAPDPTPSPATYPYPHPHDIWSTPSTFVPPPTSAQPAVASSPTPGHDPVGFFLSQPPPSRNPPIPNPSTPSMATSPTLFSSSKAACVPVASERDTYLPYEAAVEEVTDKRVPAKDAIHHRLQSKLLKIQARLDQQQPLHAEKATTAPVRRPDRVQSAPIPRGHSSTPSRLLDTVRTPPNRERTPLQSSFDSLHGELSKLSNLVSQFAVQMGMKTTETLDTGSSPVEASSSANSSHSRSDASASAYVVPEVFDTMPTPSAGYENCFAHPHQRSCVHGERTNLREQNLDYSLEQAAPATVFAVYDDKSDACSNEFVQVFTATHEQVTDEEEKSKSHQAPKCFSMPTFSPERPPAGIDIEQLLNYPCKASECRTWDEESRGNENLLWEKSVCQSATGHSTSNFLWDPGACVSTHPSWHPQLLVQQEGTVAHAPLLVHSRPTETIQPYSSQGVPAITNCQVLDSALDRKCQQIPSIWESKQSVATQAASVAQLCCSKTNNTACLESLLAHNMQLPFQQKQLQQVNTQEYNLKLTAREIQEWDPGIAFVYLQGIHENYNANSFLRPSQKYLQISEMNIIFITFLPP